MRRVISSLNDFLAVLGDVGYVVKNVRNTGWSSLPEAVIDARVQGLVGDGSTDDYAAIMRSADALGTGGGTVEIHGTARCTQTINFAGTTNVQRNSRHLRGSGLGKSKIAFEGTYTDGLRICNSSQSSVRDLEITGPSTITNLVHVTTDPNSTENVRLDNVIAIGGTNAIAVGADTHNDVAEITFTACEARGATNAAFKLGDGTAGNVLNIRFFGCIGKSSAYGVYCSGTYFSWYGGTLQTNSTADVGMGTPGDGPILIDGVRSEGSTRFWSASGGATVANPITLIGVLVRSWTASNQQVISHSSAVPMTIIGGKFTKSATSAVPKIRGGTSSANPWQLTCINVSHENTDDEDFYPPSTGNAVSLIRIGGGKIDSGGAAVTGDRLLKHFGTIYGVDGVQLKAKAGVISDADFIDTPPDYVLVYDATNNKLGVRDGGSWLWTGALS